MSYLRQQYEHALKKVIMRYEKQKQELEARLKEDIKNCPYKERSTSEDWTYHPDPSGNNDSEWECNWCGEFFKRHHP